MSVYKLYSSTKDQDNSSLGDVRPQTPSKARELENGNYAQGSLAGFGVTTPYVVISWKEMAPSEIAGAIATLAPPRQYRKVGLASGGQS